MAVFKIEELLEHKSHRVEVACYGDDKELYSVVLECMTCNIILCEFTIDIDGHGGMILGALEDDERTRVSMYKENGDKLWHIEVDAFIADRVAGICNDIAEIHSLDSGPELLGDELEQILDALSTGNAKCTRYTGEQAAEKMELEYGECECGYHFTVDSTYLEQVEDFKFLCPSCKRLIDTAEVFSE